MLNEIEQQDGFLMTSISALDIAVNTWHVNEYNIKTGTEPILKFPGQQTISGVPGNLQNILITVKGIGLMGVQSISPDVKGLFYPPDLLVKVAAFIYYELATVFMLV